MSVYNQDEEGDSIKPSNTKVPMICTQSLNGPYDDEAFSAGLQMGQIYCVLQLPVMYRPETVTIYSSLVKQADLIAMNFGFVTFVVSEKDGWTKIKFVPISHI